MRTYISLTLRATKRRNEAGWGGVFMRADVKPEVSIDREFERMLAHAVVWMRQRVLVLVLSVGAAAVIVVAFVVTYSTRVGREQAILEDLAQAERSPTEKLQELQDVARRAEGTMLAARALLAYANALYDAGRLEEARQAYERLLREHGGNFLAQPTKLALATTLEGLEESEEAGVIYEEIVAGDADGFFGRRAAERLAAMSAASASRPAESKNGP